MSFDADVVVVGAGPAGAVAAWRMAAAGRRVVLVDRSLFPRDKACGDGLIADSIGALRTLGLESTVRAQAARTTRLRTISPGGIDVQFEADFLVLPRLVLDALLVERAIAAGAEFQHAIVDGPIVDGGRIVGVHGKRADTEAPVTWRAPLTVLATGGAAAILQKFDASARVTASGLAVRTYARLPDGRELPELIISLERDLLPGYAWAFPAPNGRVNVGVGAIGGGLRAKDVNLRARLDSLLAGEGRLGSMLKGIGGADRYRGAPLRTGLTGARLGQPGLAIIGEAGGTTYAVSGEGIGKAMESGLLLAEHAAAPTPSLETAGIRYGEEMTRRHASRFRAYQTAERWIAVPWIADYVARRANRSSWVHDRLTGIITERALPNRVFSARSIWRLLTRR